MPVPQLLNSSQSGRAKFYCTPLVFDLTGYQTVTPGFAVLEIGHLHPPPFFAFSVPLFPLIDYSSGPSLHLPTRIPPLPS